MRSPALVVVLALLLAACGDVATVERLSSKEIVDGIDLPTIGMVGDFPDPGKRIVVNVTTDGGVVVDGKRINPKSIRDELDRQIPADVELVLRSDSSAPWRIAETVLQWCANERRGRVCIAVRHEGDGREGGLGCSPEDWNGGRVRGLRLIAEQVVDVPLISDPGALAGLARELRRAWTDAPKRSVLLRIRPEVSFGAVTAVMDAALRLGCEHVGVLQSSAYGLLTDNRPMNDPPQPRASSIRVNGRVVDGLTTSVSAPLMEQQHRRVDVASLTFEMDDWSDSYPLPGTSTSK